MPQDHKALNAFLAKTERRALRMAEFATRNRDDALDIVQDAMFSLCEKYAERPQDEWASLFFRILERRILDWHRRNTVRRKLFGWGKSVTDMDNPTDSIESGSALNTYTASSEDQVITEDTLEELTKALEALPLRQQQVFLLRIWEGLNVRDTAAARRCSQGSVKTHLSRATARLRAALGDELI